MLFGFSGDTMSPWYFELEEQLRLVMQEHGHQETDQLQDAGLVFHVVSPNRPRPFRRQSQATFVVGVAPFDTRIDQSLLQLYPLLVRSLSNLIIGGSDGDSAVHLVTPELGNYAVERTARNWREALYERIAPLATSHLVIDNIFDPDLPESLWDGTQVTREMRDASRTLASWELFPAPYPVADMLPAEDFRHLKKVFGIGGLSYGNLSARHEGDLFWMSASGVDKGKIGTVSRDILLVKGYDESERAIRLSVAPDSQPLRVSVDAIEHWGIYRKHPEIGALIHIHAWVDGIPSTTVNYPCGTVEMGEAMSDLLDRDPHPERTIIGLRNHGITATGPNFPDILSRLEGHVKSQVPMQ
ncbi:class II aldolase/adducin family protein [Sulfobacillus harzensis]|uniref:Class II aldolase/adducin family protein n=1 Tax=Sulfobacillus harzensis TaxID=2729629 RepID=A0A7Y0L5K8_9FIRM|nr:class II aldolase/adducin family protein [Sulfobacillus harzensis]NMP23458.1 class II aldolase/adducin family protein [Sulfobacillus harzensis]